MSDSKDILDSLLGEVESGAGHTAEGRNAGQDAGTTALEQGGKGKGKGAGEGRACSPPAVKKEQDAQAKQMLVLQAYIANGGKAYNACKDVKVPYRTHKYWLEHDPAYAEAFAQAEQAVIERYEEHLKDFVEGNIEEDIVYQGKVTGQKRQAPNLLALMFQLKKLDPRYRDNYQPDGGKQAGIYAQNVKITFVDRTREQGNQQGKAILPPNTYDISGAVLEESP